MFSLSPVERLMLTNQCRILRIVATSHVEQDYYADLIKVLDGGFEREYDRFLTRFVENCLSSEEGQLVEDTLLMSSSLIEHRSLTDLELGDYACPAFDPVDESNQLAYARYLFHIDMHGYPGVQGIVASRGAQAPRYRAMVAAWRSSPELPDLDGADITRIVAAGAFATEQEGCS